MVYQFKWPAKSKYEERIGPGVSWISDGSTVNISSVYELVTALRSTNCNAEAIPIEGGEPTQKLNLHASLAEEFRS